LGRDRDWFADPMIAGLGICTVVGFAVFVIWELTETHPVVDIRVFRHRGFSTSVGAMALVFSAYFAGIVAIPQWLQTNMNYTATLAGLTTAFTALCAILVVPLVPRLMKRLDPRLMVCIAVLNMEAMTLVRTGWTTSADFMDLAWPQMVQGLGMPLFMVPLTQLTLSTVEPDEVASAAGLQNFMRTMAVAVATSVVLTIWGAHTRLATNRIAETLQPDATLATLNQAGFGAEQSRLVIDNLVQQQATTMALDHTFLVSAIVLGVAACAIWFVPRSTTPVGGMTMGH
ncbi:MAG TPA: MFS transporter, partial [Novosphingobium sp.]